MSSIPIQYPQTFTLDGNYYTTVTGPESFRNIFNGIFIVLGFAISIFGSYFLRRKNIHQLMREKNTKIPITRMTAWLPLQAICTYVWRTKRMPGGHYGVAMLLAGGLGLGHSFFVTNLIQTTIFTVPDGCEFQFGVISTIKQGVSVISGSNLGATSTIQNAQYAALTNNCSIGIYDKIDKSNNGYYNFCPYDDNVLGRWSCDVYAANPTVQIDLPSTNTTTAIILAEVAAILQKENPNFLFPQSNGTSIQFLDSIIGMLVWSADQPNNSTEIWSLRASVFTNLLDNTPQANATNIECHLNIYNTSWTPAIMPPESTLGEWAAVAYGILQQYVDVEALPDGLGLILDTMSMSAGSQSIDNWSLPDGETATYGCTFSGTKILPEIWLLIGMMLFIFFWMLLIGFSIIAWDFVTRKKETMERMSKAELVKDAPSDVETWQRALLRVGTGNNNLDLKEMRDWSYGWDSQKEKYEFMHRTTAFESSTTGITMQSPNHSTATTASAVESKSTTKQGVEYSLLPVQSPQV